MKQKFSSLKKLLFKPAVSAVIFVTIVIIGFGVYAAINSLDDVKSAAAPSNQLTAQKWDYLVDQVKQQASTITNLQAQLATLTGNTDITPLTGNTDIIPQYMYV
ncbi:MAG: hypothetical protein LBU27_07420 [Candidatus Peribacteria bacterium]|jgi:hypothetical protein|nr:hypothetical protein [Candidatus Peribacteria bacterium]